MFEDKIILFIYHKLTNMENNKQKVYDKKKVL